MRMYPRKYSVMNRCVARAISHAVNDHYRYNRQSKSSANNSSDSGSSILLVVFILLIFLSLASACSNL